MKILITGSEGFIGSHLVERLVSEGYEVRAFIYYNSQNSLGWLEEASKSTQQNIEIFFGDIRDTYRVYEAVRGCNIVMHLAALISIPFSYTSPDLYVSTNVLGTMNILQASRQLGVEKVIHTSSSEVYGTALKVPIKEDHPLQPQSPYSASKISADNMAMSFYSSFETPVTILRPFNTYGPRQSNRAIIPTVITQILNGKKEIKLGSLHPTRDFNYVSDTVNGYIKSIKKDKIEGKIINLGTNYEVSILEVTKLIIKIFDLKIILTQDDQRIRPIKSEVERLISDNSLAKDLLGWKPEFSGKLGLKKGLTKTIEWFKNPENLKKYNYMRYNT